MKSLDQTFYDVFSKKNKIDFNFIKDFTNEEMFKSANNLVQYGWKKEAMPFIQEKNTMISKLFNLFFK